MKAVVQRVKSARVTAKNTTAGEIGRGFLIFLGVGVNDTEKDAEYIAKKCTGLRIFEDENGKMNKSLHDVGGSLLVIPNFTLYGDCSRGYRPSFQNAAAPDEANSLYQYFINLCREKDLKVETGVFGANMQIEAVNDGPVTLIIESGN